MTVVTRRRGNPVNDMLSWIEDPRLGFRALGLTPEIRIEDFVRDDTYVLRAEIPGVDPDKDLDVHVSGDHLVVRGSREEEEHEKNRHELHYGSFYRAVRLPEGARVDEIAATYTDGVLEVSLPIDAAAMTPKQIPVHRVGE